MEKNNKVNNKVNKNKFTLKQLKQYCRNNGIKGYSKYKKKR